MVRDPGGRGKGVSPYMGCTDCAQVHLILSNLFLSEFHWPGLLGRDM